MKPITGKGAESCVPIRKVMIDSARGQTKCLRAEGLHTTSIGWRFAVVSEENDEEHNYSTRG